MDSKLNSSPFKIALLGDQVIQVSILALNHSIENGPAEDCLRSVMVVLEEYYPKQLDVLLDFSPTSPVEPSQQTAVKMYCSVAQLNQVRRLALAGTGEGMNDISGFLQRSGRNTDQARVFSTIESAIDWLNA